VGAGIIAVAAIVVLLPMLFPGAEPLDEDMGRLPNEALPQFAQISLAIIPVASPEPDVAAAPVVNSTSTIRRGGDNQHDGSASVPTPPPPDDPVLIWLPEILAAAEETGVSPSLIASMIHVESQGNPAAVSPHGARGLMQIMPRHLDAQGLPEHLWLDPASNIMAGARLLGWHIERHGTHWDGVAHYFGIGCDGFNCTDGYVRNVLAWEAHYAPLIAAYRTS
jgi:hypothetical protein